MEEQPNTRQTDDYFWAPIQFSDASGLDLGRDGHFFSGDEDGVEWTVDLDPERGMWIVEATDGEHTAREEFYWTHEPHFGVDVTDASYIQIMLGKVITECRDRNLTLFKRWFKNKFMHKNR